VPISIIHRNGGPLPCATLLTATEHYEFMRGPAVFPSPGCLLDRGIFRSRESCGEAANSVAMV